MRGVIAEVITVESGVDKMIDLPFTIRLSALQKKQSKRETTTLNEISLTCTSTGHDSIAREPYNSTIGDSLDCDI